MPPTGFNVYGARDDLEQAASASDDAILIYFKPLVYLIPCNLLAFTVYQGTTFPP